MAALAAKGNSFPLAWPELRQGALSVLRQPQTDSTFQHLDQGDCDFFWAMIPVWEDQNTEETREYLATLRGYFEQYAATAAELDILNRLRQSAPRA